MPARKVVATRDEDISSEDDLVGASTRAVPKKAVKKSTNSKSATKRKAPTKQTRPVLQDRTNVHNGAEVNETAVGSDDEDIDQSKTKKARVEVPVVIKKVAQKEKPTKQTAKKAQGDRTTQKQDAVIPETQLEAVQSQIPAKSFVTDSMDSRADRNASHTRSITPAARSSQDRQETHRDKNGDKTAQIQLAASRAEHDRLTLQKEQDESSALQEARTNFDRLKEAADRKSAQADALVASLKQEIEILRAQLVTEPAALKEMKMQLERNQTKSQQLLVENQKLQSDAVRIQQDLDASNKKRADYVELKEELSTLREQYKSCDFDKKALEAKLAAARQQLVKTAKSPRGQSARATGINTTEAQREASKKENLYTDLTGLIIRGVKQKNGEDQFDCIQTGRNGSKSASFISRFSLLTIPALHFHLTVLNDTDGNPKTPGGQSYEDVEFAYEPFLDESRDKELLELLPEYLAEEICFPRNHAVKFYTKVVESMTRKVTVED